LEAANVSPSETLVWIDEALGMIIRSETKSSDGSHSRMELSEIALEVDQSVFQLPADYQKLPLLELMTRLSGVK
jgi:outer membrane lipoprotein-sorting protein